MKKKSIAAVLIFLILSLSLGSCKYFGFISPGWALEGSWTITQKPDTWVPHETFVFLSGASGYQIKDDAGTVFESGAVTNLTSLSFNYTIEQYDFDANFVSSEHYVEYSFSGTDIITMTFYADNQKSSSYGTITAARL